jgi:hypothetical protein
VRWISTVALQANLRGTNRAGEGVNDSEGACTNRGRHKCLRGARTPRGRVCTLGRRGAHAWARGGGMHAWKRRARLDKGARTPGREASTPGREGKNALEGHACLDEGARTTGRGGRMPERGCARMHSRGRTLDSQWA